MRAFVLMLVLLAGTLAVPALSAPAPPDSTEAAAPPGGSYPWSPTLPGGPGSSHFLYDSLPASSNGYLMVSINPAMLVYRAPNRSDAVLQGVGTGGTLGLFVGALGTTFGLFDDKAAWIVAGSLAATGAIYGNSRYQLQTTLRPERWTQR